MSEVRSALDALAADDLHGLSEGQVLDRTAMLVQLVNRASAELTRTVRHGELTQAAESDGLKTMRSWLIGHARLAPAEASRVVRSGRALEHFPVLAAGFADGTVTAAQVDVVATAVGAAERARAAEQGVDLAPFDEAWTAVAVGSSHSRWWWRCGPSRPPSTPTVPSRTRPRGAGCRSPGTPTAA